MLGFRDADHAETSPDAERLVITPLACSLVGQTELVRIRPGTIAHRLYGAEESMEPFFCNYGVEPAYESLLREHGMDVSGVDAGGRIRIVELTGHPFFVATLFVPQAASRPGAPHPLVSGFSGAAADIRAARGAV